MNWKRMTLAVAGVSLSLFAEAKIKPVVHYNFGKSGNVTYAVAPDKLTPVVGKGELVAVGRPVFYAESSVGNMGETPDRCTSRWAGTSPAV